MTAPDLEPATWVALIAAGVALLVGLAGPFVNARTQKRTIEAQREMANDERLWAKRAKVYEEILLWSAQADSARSDAAQAVYQGEDFEHVIERLAGKMQLPLSLQIGLDAYASEHVYEAVRRFRRSLQRVTALVVNQAGSPQAGRPPFDRKDALDEWLDEYVLGSVELRQVISDELAGKRHEKARGRGHARA